MWGHHRAVKSSWTLARGLAAHATFTFGALALSGCFNTTVQWNTGAQNLTKPTVPGSAYSGGLLRDDSAGAGGTGQSSSVILSGVSANPIQQGSVSSSASVQLRGGIYATQ